MRQKVKGKCVKFQRQPPVVSLHLSLNLKVRERSDRQRLIDHILTSVGAKPSIGILHLSNICTQGYI